MLDRIDRMVEYIENFGVSKQKYENLKGKAADYSRRSGVTQIVDEMTAGGHSCQTIFSNINAFDQASIHHHIRVDNRGLGHEITIHVSPGGTISFEGAFLLGSSRITRRRWEKNSGLVGTALTKALKHPYTVFVD